MFMMWLPYGVINYNIIITDLACTKSTEIDEHNKQERYITRDCFYDESSQLKRFSDLRVGRHLQADLLVSYYMLA